MGVLSLAGFGCQTVAEPKRIPLSVVVHRFCPELIATACHVFAHRLLCLPKIRVNLYDRTAAVSRRDPAQKQFFVRGAHKHTLSRPPFLFAPVGGTVAVLLAGNEAFQLLHGTALHADQLPHLHNPFPLHGFHTLLPFYRHHGVGEPFATHDREERRLAAPFRAAKDQEVIEFHTRFPHPGTRPHEEELRQLTV